MSIQEMVLDKSITNFKILRNDSDLLIWIKWETYFKIIVQNDFASPTFSDSSSEPTDNTKFVIFYVLVREIRSIRVSVRENDEM